MELHPKKCQITNEVFSYGFKVGDNYFLLKMYADRFSKKEHGISFNELCEHSENETNGFKYGYAYYGTWSDEHIISQGFGYTPTGQKIFVGILDEQKQAEETIKKHIEYVESCIANRQNEQYFSGTRDELYDSELEHPDFENWSNEYLENHSYDLGAYYNLKLILSSIKKSEEKDEAII